MLIYLQMIESGQEKDKFEKLYLKYRDLMYHSAFTILHNREDSEDSVHQAFVSIIENLDKIGDTDSAETRSFCVLCCRNKALDLYRRKNRWGELELFENLHELPITAYAAGPRRISGSPSLSFSGTTATCKLSVISAGSTIDCTLTLYEGDTIIQSWSGSNTGYLLLSGSTTVQHGHTYTLSGSGSVNGSPITISPVTRTCP